MAKAKLATLTEKWINGKTEKQNIVDNEQKIKQTLYMSRKAVKLLGHNRAETGEPMSHTVEQLILKHIQKR